MKLLVYSSYYKPYTSGLTVYTQRVIEHLAKKHDITTLTFRYESLLPASETERSNSIIRMPYEFRLSKGFISIQSLKYFWRLAHDADNIIITMPNAEATPLVYLASILKKPIIALYLCDVDLGPGVMSHLITYGLRTSLNFQLRRASHIIAFPDYIQHRPFYSLYKDKIMECMPPVVYHLPNTSFAKALAADKQRKKWIGFVGRLSREKGIEYLIEAVHRINNPHYELVLAGPDNAVGEQKYADSIMARLKALGIHTRRYTSLTDEELAAFYEALDVLVLPSLNSTEAFGMVQAEAMLHGTPAISTNLPGVRVPIQKTGAGLIVPRRNTKALSHAINTLLTTPLTRTEVTRRAREVFNPSDFYKTLDTLLSSNQ